MRLLSDLSRLSIPMNMQIYTGQPQMMEDPPWLRRMLEAAPPEKALPVSQGIRIGQLIEKSKTAEAWRRFELTEILLTATIGSIGTAIGLALGGYFAGYFTKENRS